MYTHIHVYMYIHIYVYTHIHILEPAARARAAMRRSNKGV